MLKRFFIALFLFPLVIEAQVQDVIITDRPSFSESAYVVPFRSLQFELGSQFRFSSFDSPKGERTSTDITALDALVRYGLFRRFEVRVAGLLFNSIEFGENSFLNNAGLGFKYQPIYEKGLKPNLTLFAHWEWFRSDKPEANLDRMKVVNKIAASWTILKKGGILVNLGTLYDYEGYLPNTNTLSTMFSYSFTNRFGAFAEYALVLPEEGDNVQFIDAGVTYLAKERLQFDAIYIHRLAGKSNYNELKVGISFRLME
ncbi:MAG TPA: hypothetical protein DDX92_08345 [Flavobacteriales bacterium]|jgi:hypothetical protein|nr:hypothetical protein [Flavobacteriales bacterium]